jgi:hypothetical protein
MSVRLHYPEVFDGSSVMDLMIRLKASLISNKDLIGHSGWPGMRARDKLQRGRLRLGRNFPWTIARQMMRLRQHGINHKFTKQEATQTLHMFGRITKRRRTQLYVARTTS